MSSVSKDSGKKSKINSKLLLSNSKTKSSSINTSTDVNVKVTDPKATEETNIVLNSKPIIDDIASNKPKTNKKKCANCGKKLKLLESSLGKCQCDKFFCISHRYPEVHECTFDYKEPARKQLEVQHQKIVADKIKNRI